MLWHYKLGHHRYYIDGTHTQLVGHHIERTELVGHDIELVGHRTLVVGHICHLLRGCGPFHCVTPGPRGTKCNLPLWFHFLRLRIRWMSKI